MQGTTLAPPPVRSRPAEPEPEAAPTPTRPKSTASRPGASRAAPSASAVTEAASSSTASGGGAGNASVPAPAASEGYPIETVGSAVTVVTREDLQRQQIRNAGEALRNVPGVSVNRGGSVAGQMQVRIRGSEANHTLVLIDGIVANQPGTGEFDFSNLPAEQIERIEVIRGPHSGLYGSGALGGVVNIVTRSGKGPATATVWGEVGTFKTAETGVSVAGGTENAHGLVSYSGRNTNGFNVSIDGTETDAAQHRNFLFKGGVKPADGLAFDVILRNVDKHGDRDGDLFAGSGLSRQIDSFSHFASSLWLAGFEGRLDTLGGALAHKVSLNYAQTILEDWFVDPFFSSYSRNDNARTKAGYVGTFRFDTPALMGSAKHAISALVEADRETFIPVTDDGLARERNRVATAAEYKIDLFDRLHVAANVRHDDNDTFADFTTWRTSASLRLKEIGLRPHASVGTGVKLPTMVEQFGQFAGFIANPNVRAEESTGWDAGLELTLLNGTIVVDATYFKSNLSNEIVTRFLPGFQSTVENLTGESTRRGVEVGGRWRPLSNLSFGAAYTWLDARDDQGLREIRRAPSSGRIDASLGFGDGRGNLTVAANYNGRAEDIAFGLPFFSLTRVTLEDYWLVTAAASWTLTPGVEVYGRIENLLDQNYQEVYGFNTAGAAAYAGVKLTFGGDGQPALTSKSK